jgi:chromate transporter
MSAPSEGPIEKTEEGSLKQLVGYFLRLGTFGFGGPIALCGYMQRDLVERRGWLSAADYKEGIALAQLAPGPLAAQLAIYIGWVRGRILGATLVGAAFVLPSFLMVLALSVVYVSGGGLTWMQGAFYGIGAAVIAIIARSAVKLVKMTLARDAVLWALFVVNAAATAVFEQEIVSLIIASGLVLVVARGAARPVSPGAALGVAPAWLFTGLLGAASTSTLWTLTLFFAQAGAFVFGSGLAIVPFLYGGVVEQHHWLTEQQFLDAVAVAMITPGPVVITVAFIGYLVGGLAGATLAAAATFLPCYLFTVLPAPYFRRFAQNRTIRAFVDGVTAAATGAIAGAAIVLGRRAIYDLPTIAIFAATFVILWRTKKIPEPIVILAAGVVGYAIASFAAP